MRLWAVARRLPRDMLHPTTVGGAGHFYTAGRTDGPSILSNPAGDETLPSEKRTSKGLPVLSANTGAYEFQFPTHRRPTVKATPGRPMVIALANQKGGVAKTTTTLNLAVAFAEEGHRVLCCDMDPQGNLTMSQGIDPDTLDNSMYDVLVHHV